MSYRGKLRPLSDESFRDKGYLDYPQILFARERHAARR